MLRQGRFVSTLPTITPKEGYMTPDEIQNITNNMKRTLDLTTKAMLPSKLDIFKKSQIAKLGNVNQLIDSLNYNKILSGEAKKVLLNHNSTIERVISSFTKPYFLSETLFVPDKLKIMDVAKGLVPESQINFQERLKSFGGQSFKEVYNEIIKRNNKITQQYQSDDRYITSYENLSRSYHDLIDTEPKKRSPYHNEVLYTVTEEFATASQSMLYLEDRYDLLNTKIYKDHFDDSVLKIKDEIPLILEQIDPDFVRLWNGAIQTIQSSNPDKSRHLSASLRELLENFIRKFAPEKEIQQWTQDEADFHEGKSKRQTRLRFIFRKHNSGPLVNFFERNLILYNSVMKTLQKGTHNISAIPREEDLIFTLLRTGTLIHSIFTIREL